MPRNIYQVNHCYNKNYAGVQASPRLSFSQQIDQLLTQWRSIKSNQSQCKRMQHCEEIDFDRIMEQDIEYQLQELQRQENEQYQLLENKLDQQSHDGPYQEIMDDFEKEHNKLLGDLDALKAYARGDSLDSGPHHLKTENSTDRSISTSQVYLKQEKVQVNDWKQHESKTSHLQTRLKISEKDRIKVRKLIHLLELYTKKFNVSAQKFKHKKKWRIF